MHASFGLLLVAEGYAPYMELVGGSMLGWKGSRNGARKL
jgi:hypothetical protein